jgi:hypothetical protein
VSALSDGEDEVIPPIITNHQMVRSQHNLALASGMPWGGGEGSGRASEPALGLACRRPCVRLCARLLDACYALSRNVVAAPVGAEQRVLAVVTTMELDPRSPRYKKRLVEKLSDAAHDYVHHSDHVSAFVLMNRPKDWVRPTMVHRHHQCTAGGRFTRRGGMWSGVQKSAT